MGYVSRCVKVTAVKLTAGSSQRTSQHLYHISDEQTAQSCMGGVPEILGSGSMGDDSYLILDLPSTIPALISKRSLLSHDLGAITFTADRGSTCIEHPSSRFLSGR